MGPKRVGHNAMGKAKLFRNAIEHAHVGVGHRVLGNATVMLTPLPPSPFPCGHERSPSSTGTELAELMLSHTSEDFREFRYDVEGRVETVGVLKANATFVVERLIHAMARKDANDALPAFVKLTIALARDLQEQFTPFAISLNEALIAALYDGAGQLVTDVATIQYIFMAQSQWFRELAPLIRRHFLGDATPVIDSDSDVSGGKVNKDLTHHPGTVGAPARNAQDPL